VTITCALCIYLICFGKPITFARKVFSIHRLTELNFYVIKILLIYVCSLMEQICNQVLACLGIRRNISFMEENRTSWVKGGELVRLLKPTYIIKFLENSNWAKIFREKYIKNKNGPNQTIFSNFVTKTDK
jgi:hypothetical protein